MVCRIVGQVVQGSEMFREQRLPMPVMPHLAFDYSRSPIPISLKTEGPCLPSRHLPSSPTAARTSDSPTSHKLSSLSRWTFGIISFPTYLYRTNIKCSPTHLVSSTNDKLSTPLANQCLSQIKPFSVRITCRRLVPLGFGVEWGGSSSITLQT
jgi:hypothetical protein